MYEAFGVENTPLRVLLHQASLCRGQRSLLLQDLRGNGELADIVKNARHTQMLDRFVVHMHGSPEMEQQGRNRQRVHKGCAVSRAQARA